MRHILVGFGLFSRVKGALSGVRFTRSISLVLLVAAGCGDGGPDRGRDVAAEPQGDPRESPLPGDGVRLLLDAGEYSLTGEFSRTPLDAEEWSAAIAHAREVLRENSPDEFAVVEDASDAEVPKLLEKVFPQLRSAHVRTRGQQFTDRLSIVGECFTYDRQIKYGDGGVGAKFYAFARGTFWEASYPVAVPSDSGGGAEAGPTITSERRDVFVSNSTIQDSLDGALLVIACELGRAAVCRDYLKSTDSPGRSSGRIVDSAGSGAWEALVARLAGSGAILYNGMVSKGGALEWAWTRKAPGTAGAEEWRETWVDVGGAPISSTYIRWDVEGLKQIKRDWYVPGVAAPFATVIVDAQRTDVLGSDDVLGFRYFDGDAVFDMRVEPPVVHRGIDSATFRLPMPKR
jgi:hypothetical protein